MRPVDVRNSILSSLKTDDCENANFVARKSDLNSFKMPHKLFSKQLEQFEPQKRLKE